MEDDKRKRKEDEESVIFTINCFIKIMLKMIRHVSVQAF